MLDLVRRFSRQTSSRTCKEDHSIQRLHFYLGISTSTPVQVSAHPPVWARAPRYSGEGVPGPVTSIPKMITVAIGLPQGVETAPHPTTRGACHRLERSGTTTPPWLRKGDVRAESANVGGVVVSKDQPWPRLLGFHT